MRHTTSVVGKKDAKLSKQEKAILFELTDEILGARVRIVLESDKVFETGRHDVTVSMTGRLCGGGAIVALKLLDQSRLFQFCHIAHHSLLQSFSIACELWVIGLHPGVGSNLRQSRPMLMVVSHHLKHEVFEFFGEIKLSFGAFWLLDRSKKISVVAQSDAKFEHVVNEHQNEPKLREKTF